MINKKNLFHKCLLGTSRHHSDFDSDDNELADNLLDDRQIEAGISHYTSFHITELDLNNDSSGRELYETKSENPLNTLRKYSKKSLIKSIESFTLFHSEDEVPSSLRGNQGFERGEKDELGTEFLNTDRSIISGTYNTFITRRSNFQNRIGQNMI